LPNAVVDVDSLDIFKSRLDRFGCFNVDLTGIPEIDLSMTLKIIEKCFNK